MAFRNIVLNEEISYGARGGPVFSTTVITTNGGYEQRNINWDIPMTRWDVGHIIDSEEKRRYFLRFFRAQKGRGHSFLFKDWSDYTVVDSTDTGFNEGTMSLISGANYQLQKRYYDGVTSEYRDIKRLKSGTFALYDGVTLLVASTHYTVDITTGILTILGGATFTHWIGEFYFQARFDTDEANITLMGPTTGEWPDVSIVEVRE